ncbi:MAG: hypothetical protein J0H50_12795 [Xanthomonadales bacterium]|nr:hypothetical protein [Xanthomonadales bacterium]
MDIQKNQTAGGAAHGREPARCFRLLIAIAACATALYALPGQATEPLSCNPTYGDIDVTDARYVAAGTDCYTLRLTVHSTGTLSNAGALTNYLGLDNNAGGRITNAVGGSILLYGSFVNNGHVDNLGRVDAYRQGVNSGSFGNYGTVLNTAGFTNSGSFINQGGTFQSQAPLMNLGSLMNGPGSQLVSSDVISNVGTIMNVSGAQLFNNDSLVNSGTLTNLGGNIHNAGDLRNLGTFENQLGAVVNIGDLANLVTLRNGLNGTFGNFGTLSNQGRLVNQALGTLTNYATLSNQRTLRNEEGGTLVNHGRFSNALGATLENAGTLTNSPLGELTNQGAVSNGPDGVLANQGTLTNGKSGTFTNRGSMTNAVGAGVANTGTLNNEAGAHFNNAGRLHNDGVINNAGTLVTGAVTGTVVGSGTYIQTAGSTVVVDGAYPGLSQGEITINGGQLIGDGRIASPGVVTIAAAAILAPGDGLGDVGALDFNAPLDLFGSLDIDLNGLAYFDSVSVGGLSGNGAVTFSPDGSTWFSFYLGGNTSQNGGDTFDFFSAQTFANFDAVNFRCLGLMSGLDCGLGMVDGGRGIQLMLFDNSGGGGAEEVPEPGPLGTMLFGLALLWIGRGWRRQQARATLEARSRKAPARP